MRTNREVRALDFAISAFLTKLSDLILHQKRSDLTEQLKEIFSFKSFIQPLWKMGFNYEIVRQEQDNSGNISDLYIRIYPGSWKKEESYIALRIMPSLGWRLISGTIVLTSLPQSIDLSFSCESMPFDLQINGLKTILKR